jgi:thioredoxin 1
MEEITQNNFHTKIKNGITLLDFYASWCAPCKLQKPILEKFEAENKDVNVYCLDIDDNQELCYSLNIKSVPTLIWFKNGEMVQVDIGLKKESQILETLEKLK